MDKHYESTVIINASLDDAQIEQVVNRISETITKGGGTINELNKWGRKRLAYAINKKTNGYYVHFEFTAPSPLIATLERGYQLDEMILRYLTIVLDSRAIAAKKAATTPPPQETTEVPKREPLFASDGK